MCIIQYNSTVIVLYIRDHKEMGFFGQKYHPKLLLRICVFVAAKLMKNVFGPHSLSYRCSRGRIPRHAVVNETIFIVLWCLEVYLLFWRLSVCVEMIVRGQMEMSMIP